MENQLIRLFILVVLVFLLTSDIKDLLDALSTTSTVGPYLSNWRPGQPQHQHGERDGLVAANSKSKKKSSKAKVVSGRGQTLPNTMNDLSGEEEEFREDEFEPPVRYHNAVSTGKWKLRRKSGPMMERVNPNDPFASMTGMPNAIICSQCHRASILRNKIQICFLFRWRKGRTVDYEVSNDKSDAGVVPS